MKMNKLPSVANSEKGDLSGEGRLGECPKGRASGKSQNAKPSRMDGGTESKPYAGWCGTGELTTPRDPIGLLILAGVKRVQYRLGLSIHDSK
jgi:hypothetical protein